MVDSAATYWFYCNHIEKRFHNHCNEQKNSKKTNIKNICAHKTIQQQPKEKNSKYNPLNSDLKTQNKTACYLITEFQCYSHVSL